MYKISIFNNKIEFSFIHFESVTYIKKQKLIYGLKLLFHSHWSYLVGWAVITKKWPQNRIFLLPQIKFSHVMLNLPLQTISKCQWLIYFSYIPFKFFELASNSGPTFRFENLCIGNKMRTIAQNVTEFNSAILSIRFYL